MTSMFKGTYAALLTGFADNGDLDQDRQNNIVDYVLKQDLTGLYVGGSSGESGLMSTDELLAQQIMVRDRAKGRETILIAHVGQPNLADSIQLARQAKDLGYQALSALPPHSYPFSDEEILDYYTALASATDLPMIVYEIPIRTGRALPFELLGQLLQLPNVIGMKFTSPDMFKLCLLRKHHPDKIFFYGFDEVLGAAVFLGADGGIGTTYNVLGNLYTAIDRAVRAGEVEKARQMQSLSQEYVEKIMATGVMPGVKFTLQCIGVDCGPCRKPMKLRSEAAQAELKAFVATDACKQWLAL